MGKITLRKYNATQLPFTKKRRFYRLNCRTREAFSSTSKNAARNLNCSTNPGIGGGLPNHLRKKVSYSGGLPGDQR